MWGLRNPTAVTPCSLVDKYKRFGETCYFQLQSKNNTLWKDARDLSKTSVCVQQNTGCQVPAQSYLYALLPSNSAFCYPNLSVSDFQTNETWNVNAQNFIIKWKSTALKQSQQKAHLAVHRTSGLKGNETNKEPVFSSLAQWQNIYLSAYNVFHITTLSG